MPSSGRSPPAERGEAHAAEMWDVLWLQTAPGIERAQAEAQTRGLRLDPLEPQRAGSPPDGGPLVRAAAGLAAYDGVLVGSERAATALVEAVPPGITYRGPVFVVGPATRDRLRATPRVRHVLGSDLRLADPPRAEGLLAVLERDLGSLTGRRLLLPRPEQGRDLLRSELPRRGAILDAPVAYAMVPAGPWGLALAQRLGTARTVAAMSGEGLREVAGREGSELLRQRPLFVVGPVAAEQARSLGLPVTGVATEPGVGPLLQVVQDHLTSGARDG